MIRETVQPTPVTAWGASLPRGQRDAALARSRRSSPFACWRLRKRFTLAKAVDPATNPSPHAGSSRRNHRSTGRFSRQRLDTQYPRCHLSRRRSTVSRGRTPREARQFRHLVRGAGTPTNGYSKRHDREPTTLQTTSVAPPQTPPIRDASPPPSSGISHPVRCLRVGAHRCDPCTRPQWMTRTERKPAPTGCVRATAKRLGLRIRAGLAVLGGVTAQRVIREHARRGGRLSAPAQASTQQTARLLIGIRCWTG